MPNHAFDAGFVEQIGAVFDFQIDGVGTVGQHQCKVEFRGSALGQDRLFDLKALQPDAREPLIAVTPIEQHLEERGMTRAAFRLDCPHHLVKRRRAVGVKIKHALLHPK